MRYPRLIEFIHISPKVIADIESGQRIQAIKAVRNYSGCGLREAKEAVDDWIAGDRCTMAQEVAGVLLENFLLRHEHLMSEIELRAWRQSR